MGAGAFVLAGVMPAAADEVLPVDDPECRTVMAPMAKIMEDAENAID